MTAVPMDGAGETLGGVIGQWAGRVIGGVVGEMIDPAGGAVIGAVIGGKVGQWAGKAAGAYLASKMENANEKVEEKTKDAATTDACSTCPKPECDELNKQIKERRDELQQRYDEMREDKLDLFNQHRTEAESAPGIGSWDGHVKQFQQKQRSLRKMLDAARSKGCSVTTDDAGKLGTTPAPTAPAPKPGQPGT